MNLGELSRREMMRRAGADYDPYRVVPKFLAEVRAAIAATEAITPLQAPENTMAKEKPVEPDRPARKKANKNKSAENEGA